LQPATGRGSPRFSGPAPGWQASGWGFASTQRSTLKDDLTSKRPGRVPDPTSALRSPVPALMLVCRENGALLHRWSRQRRRTIRVCIEPALAGSRGIATGGLGTRLSRPGARTNSLPPARSSPRRFTHRQLPAGWLRGANSATGRPLGSTHRATLRWLLRLRAGYPRASRLRTVRPDASPPVVASSAAPRLRPAPPKGPRSLAVRRPPPRPRCGARHTGRMLSNTNGCFRGSIVDAHGVPEGPSLAAALPSDSAPGVPGRHPGWSARSRGHQSVVRWVRHGTGHNAQASPPAPEGSAPPPLPRSRSARRPAGHRAGCRARAPAARSSLPERRDGQPVGTRTRHLHRCRGRSPVPGCSADLDHRSPRFRSCQGGVVGSESQRSLPPGQLSRSDAKRAAETAHSAPSVRAGTIARSTG
jgi:hypothetical protein